MLPGLVWQDGYDYTAIQIIMDAYNVEADQRPRLISAVIKLIDVVEKERKARHKK